MKIVYVEDSQKARGAAMTAAKTMSVELILFSSVSKAFQELSRGALDEADFIISDLFFVEEPNRMLSIAYKHYIARIEKSLNEGWSASFVRRGPIGELATTEEELYRLRHGKVSRKYLKRCLKGEEEYYFSGNPQKVLEQYKQLPREYALGAPFVLQTWKRNKKAAIFSEIHRHGAFIQGAGIVTIPLIVDFPQFFEYDGIFAGGKYYRGKYITSFGFQVLSPYMIDAKKTKEGFEGLFKVLQETMFEF